MARKHPTPSIGSYEDLHRDLRFIQAGRAIDIEK
jgi:hypothetical protein